jgi:hypothetical protein
MGRIVFQHGDKTVSTYHFPYTPQGSRGIVRAEKVVRKLASAAKSSDHRTIRSRRG